MYPYSRAISVQVLLTSLRAFYNFSWESLISRQFFKFVMPSSSLQLIPSESALKLLYIFENV